MIRTLPDIGVLTHGYSSVVATAARGKLADAIDGKHPEFDAGRARVGDQNASFFIDAQAAGTMSRLASRSGKILMAASVMKRVSARVGTSMIRTWLMRRAIGRPVVPEVTARISSSVCGLPFMRSSR